MFRTEEKMRICSTVFVDGKLKPFFGHFTDQPEEADKIAFAGTVGTDQDIHIPEPEIFEFSDGSESFYCQCFY